jgi:4-hydroxy-3-polyprenylbenzoate decarboxylase
VSSDPERIVVGITGATGIVYAVRALDVLRERGIETHLIVTRAADLTRAYETGLSRRELAERADHVWSRSDVGAPLSSGSFRTRGMLIAPASMRAIGEIAGGVASSLLSRAAGVTLEQRRPLVLLVRESPLNLIHLRDMAAVTGAGATIMSPVPAFSFRPANPEDVIDHTVGRALDQFGIHTDIFPRWDDALRHGATRGQDEPRDEHVRWDVFDG